MADAQAPAQYYNPVVDPNCVPRPYPARTDHIPTSMNAIDAAWLSRMMSYKYPGVVASNMETLELLNSHTTKWRIKVDWNDAGIAAGLPAHLCMKANWSGAFDNVDIHALEARFYHFMVQDMKVPTATCYYADWDDDGSAHGIVILEDLVQRGGKFGHTAGGGEKRDDARVYFANTPSGEKNVYTPRYEGADGRNLWCDGVSGRCD